MRPARIRSACLAILAAACLALPQAARADDAAGQWRIGASLLGDVKHTVPFDHFDYVNGEAPKGGRVRMAVPGSYDSFNVIPLKGVQAAGLGGYRRGIGLYESLMMEAQDEPSSQYGEIAEAVRFPADYSSVTFRLNPRARWQDAQPITTDDVIWSFQIQKENNLQFANYYKNVAKVETSGPGEVTFTFDKAGNRELPQIMGQLTVLPKHWWLAKGADGKPRDPTATNLEPPMGSGPYRIKSFEPGRSVTYERVKDWWGADLPFGKGQYNFDEVHYDYYLNTQQMPDFFKADSYDFRFENVIANWMQLYNIPAVEQGRIVKQDFPSNSIGLMQAFAFNLRRPKFQDIRVRQALNDVFDFEEMNRTLFFGQYKRTSSYFAGLDLAAKGLPEGRELDILNTVRDKVPPQIFTTPYTNPVNGSDEARRANFHMALGLLKDAGWEIRNGKLTNVKTGEVMTIELLLGSETFTRVALVYQQGLKRIGIDVVIRTPDDAQFEQRQNNRDFDMIMYAQAESQSPGNEQRDYWSSAAADGPGSQNIMGIKDAAVDALIDRVIYAKDRPELVAATKALDRVLMAGSYVVPMWYSPSWHTLRWNRFGQPAVLPSQSPTGGFPTVWWYDPALAAKTGPAK